MRDLYRVLQVDVAADADVIAAAFRVLARKLHPDRGERDTARMAELNQAYAVLRDPHARARYDRERRGIVAPAAPTTPTTPRAGPSMVAGRAGDSRAGDARIDFGRYEGWTLREIARRDLDYLRWLSRHASGARHRAEIAVLLREFDPPKPRAAGAG